MKRAIASLAALLLVAGSAVAEEGADATTVAHVEYRQKVMHAIGANMGAIGDILKNQLPLQDNIAVHAKELELGASLIESAFHEPAMDEDTEALPLIWERWEEFAAAASSFKVASGKLVTVAATGDRVAIGKAVREVGQTCGGCHHIYRKQED